MAINRRNFIRASLGSAALASLAACSNASASSQKALVNNGCYDPSARLNISLQEGVAPGETLAEKLDFMEKIGVTGLEISGRVSRRDDKTVKYLPERVEELKKALSGRNIKISAICAGFSGFILSEDEKVRQECIDSMNEIIKGAGALGSVGVIIVPAFNRQEPCKPHTAETRTFLCEEFKKMGDFALQHNTTVIFEPLNRREAHYLRQVADAASLCRDTACEGVKCMGDFWHMTWEETSDKGAFLSAGKKYLQHVHVASRKNRWIPGLDGDADNYIDGFQGLKMIGYDKYVSFECGVPRDREVDRAAAVTAAVQLLRDQWEQA
ncbi:MAG: sugar phosphate isomerase/epimerase [Tannerella sp.]|jgi:sugar phosphate isomerase/epimerase|nr:sugar phosphate isomerase/epimerase [Tannerella sp.]